MRCIYVCDEENDSMQVFDLRGTFIRVWGGHTALVKVNSTTPCDYVVSGGLLYVSDWGNNRIQAFEKEQEPFRAAGVCLAPDRASFITLVAWR